MARPAAVLAAALLLGGCAGSEPPVERTARERDSALGASEILPGTAGVRGAMAAGDTAAARNAQRDSIAALP